MLCITHVCGRAPKEEGLVDKKRKTNAEIKPLSNGTTASVLLIRRRGGVILGQGEKRTLPGLKETIVQNLGQLDSMVEENENEDKWTNGHNGPTMLSLVSNMQKRKLKISLFL